MKFEKKMMTFLFFGDLYIQSVFESVVQSFMISKKMEKSW